MLILRIAGGIRHILIDDDRDAGSSIFDIDNHYHWIRKESTLGKRSSFAPIRQAIPVNGSHSNDAPRIQNEIAAALFSL
ncbi:hypothetical protein GXP70_07670 [Paenibacillus lycopersici]|uniref:Uncharacterized protein n=1 Tax=Paenibacillus lycopersici TaxID=2704462 RepID=A0A6C0FXZ7_9BACL|nr:hypothetical protein [Paenibacillus lycopersici]QHT59839.1 hypothetical protein GXP70_07670 [Paenibacillus lycopersici]